MKFKLIFLSFISSISLCALTSPLAIAANTEKDAPRWFEIEVILFKQLGDKKLLKERFFDDEKLPEYARYYDLLTPYLQPNISVLKQLLSQCELESEPEIPLNFIDIKSLYNIETQPSETLEEGLTEELATPIESIVVDNSSNDTNGVIAENQSVTVPQYNNLTEPEDITSNNTMAEDELHGLTEVQLALVEAAEQKFENRAFINSPRYPYFPNNKFCLVNTELTQQKLSDVNAQNNAFPVSEVPKIISASGLRDDSQPYLIHEDSLQLRDIITRLKWSRNFKPLLHLGWRQIGITRNDAIPVKVFAGEHLEQSYQQAVNQQKEKQADDELKQKIMLALKDDKNSGFDSTIGNRIDSHINSDASNDNENKNQQLISPLTNITDKNNEINEQTELPMALTPSQQQQLAQLKQLFEKIALIDQKTLDEKILNEHTTEQSINSMTAASNKETVNSTTLNSDDAGMQITKPVQPWLLDGFIKVHLDHYLYITADFNIARDAFSSEENQQIDDYKTSKTINFSQDRRVISGEVHYFDHPYMGMVVQIRRFDPTKPDDEAVTQAVR